VRFAAGVAGADAALELEAAETGPRRVLPELSFFTTLSTDCFKLMSPAALLARPR